jgi:hypothetical protein
MLKVPRDIRRGVEQYGREYIPVPRPKGFRRGKPGQCWTTALAWVRKHPEATYVEGIATIYGREYHHCWITLDGVHAIDPTWPKPGERYIGLTGTPLPNGKVRLNPK